MKEPGWGGFSGGGTICPWDGKLSKGGGMRFCCGAWKFCCGIGKFCGKFCCGGRKFCC